MAKRVNDIIIDAADRYGLDAAYLNRVAKIESGFNPSARTGSYRGLFQLSPSEFARGGGRGNIYDPEQNAYSAAALMAMQRDEFTQKYGRPPTPTEAYMIHQQGAGGLDAHLANPDQPAWQSMYSTAEGRQKGPEWAKQAIWGNIPDDLKRQFGNVNNVTSSDFINKVWLPKVEGPGSAPAEERVAGSPAGLPVQAGTMPEQPAPRPVSPTAVARADTAVEDILKGQEKPVASAATTPFNFQLPGQAVSGGFRVPEAPTLASLQPAAVQMVPIASAPTLLARYGRTV